jgi:uncharacterized glyoxalase superfamily protein PhnB
MTDTAHITTTSTPSSSDGPPSVWPSQRYPDPQAAIDFLVGVFGFEATELVPTGEAGHHYAHVELRWPHGSGGVMIGSSDQPVEGWLYVVTPDPDALYERAKAADLEITREMEDTEYGNRTFSVRDPWSVQWSFGTYQGR